MLKRIYADNFKCLVNFTWEPGPGHINLMLGPNGWGKSTVFDCLERVGAFVTGESKIDDLFPSSTLTLWQNVPTQSFEIEWERQGSVYRYELAIEHDENRTHRWVAHERLHFDDKPLLESKLGEVTLHSFLGVMKSIASSGTSEPMAPTYSIDATLSAMASLPANPAYANLTWFKTALRRVTVVQIVPPMMDETSMRESQRPLRYFQNFVSWYRWVSQDQGMVSRLQQVLKEILPGFSHFNLESVGPEAKLLKAVFNQKGKPLSFGSLSDGQRMLVALYALLHGLAAQPEGLEGSADRPAGMLCLDEPDNFVASGEIQPWLIALADQLTDAKSRVLMISHHPESIDYALMPSSEKTYSAFWFSREEGSHTRVQPVAPEEPGGLKPSELAARGWLGS
jgi:energy-coupling factor transporter ATP-binding protein EcfA2